MQSLRDMVNDLDTPLTAHPHKHRNDAPAPIKRGLSAVSQGKYADLFDGLDDMALPDATIDAVMDNRELLIKNHARTNGVLDVADRNREQARAMRDAHKGKDMIRTSADAKGKLKELKYRESFCVPDELSHNMQALISYYNTKPEGKRFKSKRVGNDRTLEITRMR